MITGVRTFPSPDAFDPYGVREGLIEAVPSFDPGFVKLQAISHGTNGSGISLM